MRKSIIKSIGKFSKKHGYPPTVRDICFDLNYVSTGSMVYHLDILQAEGKILRDPHVARSIRLKG